MLSDQWRRSRPGRPTAEGGLLLPLHRLAGGPLTSWGALGGACAGTLPGLCSSVPQALAPRLVLWGLALPGPAVVAGLTGAGGVDSYADAPGLGLASPLSYSRGP